MNEHFSLRRFGLLLRKYSKEHFRSYLLYTASLLGILLLIGTIVVLNQLHAMYQPFVTETVFISGLIFCSSIFSASFYSFFQNKAKAIRFINIPASVTEKIGVSFLFTQLVCFATYLLLFLLTDRLICGGYNRFHKIPDHTPIEDLQYFVAHPLNLLDNFNMGAILFALMLSSIMHFGSLCFEKNAFVKTAPFFLVIGAIVFNYNFYSMKAMIPGENMPGGKLFNEGVRLGSTDNIKGFISLPENWYYAIYWLLPGSVYLLFWAASFYKLKEKQV